MEGTKVLLEQEADMKVTTAGSGAKALERLKEQSFDILMVDLSMPGLNGIELVQSLLQIDADAVILIYSGFPIEPHFNHLVDAGISGYVPKTVPKEKLVQAIRCAAEGDTVIPTALFRSLRRGFSGTLGMNGVQNIPIKDKEFTILKYLAQGKSNKEMAESLIMSQRTLEYALTQLFQKLNVKSRRDAVTKSKELGLLINDDFY
jgi:two-component system competent response regulator ComA